MTSSRVAVIMGSKSDWNVVQGAIKVLRDFGVSFEAHVMSAHRTPNEAAEFAASAEAKGFKVIICAAGMAAHLGGVMAAHTTLPVIGIPIASEPFNGIDALFSIVQMPPGIPVAAVTAGKAGGKNAALFAVEILATADAGLAKLLKEFRAKQAEGVREADEEIQDEINSL